MFTGLVLETGKVLDIIEGQNNYSITVLGNKILKDVSLGDSISTNGVCLTVTDYTQDNFTVDVMPKTLSVTSLNSISPGSIVNLEPALTLSSPLGGHLVSGHIDTIGYINAITMNNNAYLIDLDIKAMDPLLVTPKGSITIDGISLTIAELYENGLQVSIIPHTYTSTNLNEKSIGSIVNIEYDIIGKYIKRHVKHSEDINDSSNINMNFLAENNFL